ncbi:glycosyltransferase family 2 protein [Ruegeria pomeroyi]|uniref:glycosyltransferase family 2 protein n=1 Tax=Ruegeria pomeroyi TaxID=89184 RepID=UPI001F3C14A8|nr:glycosyltransferase family 2 protein [Ruegeria pomeroyi]MCE8510000.1 glycosyltransferase family 2 protein [Ruegeria pomeroyi]
MSVRVSVVIPVFDRRESVRAAIASARRQTVPPVEIIVVDDASTDGTAEELAQFERDVRVIRLTERKGAAHARNVGIAAAIGSHVAFLDSDDLYLPDKLETQLNLMARDAADFATCAYTTSTGGRRMTRPASSARLHRINCRGGTSGLIAATDLLRACPFDAGMRAVQDWELYLRLERQARGVHVVRPLYLYNTANPDRISRQKRRRFIGHMQLYRRHILGADTATWRDHLAHRIVQAMLVSDLKGRRFCWLATRVAYRVVTL